MIVVDEVASATCDPTMLICDCPDTGCEDGGEWVGPPPTDPVIENAVIADEIFRFMPPAGTRRIWIRRRNH